LRSGPLDTEVIFQSAVKSTGAGGGKVLSWSTTFTDWAQVIRLTGKEKYESAKLTEIADIKMRMRYRTNITVEMRFIVGGEFYNIYSVNEIPRQRGVEILGKLIDKT